MSHFTVLVPADSYEHLKAVLAPYQENNMGDCPQERWAGSGWTVTIATTSAKHSGTLSRPWMTHSAFT
jgi:hypothetical protein